MKRFYFCTTFLFLILSFVNSQQMKPVDIPTPQAANLGQYGDISMSYYTGKADIIIPLYSFTIRDVTLPISLSYDNGGVLINSLPGWTGHNWTLSAGGAITRVVQGRYDEYIYPYGAMLTYPAYNYFQSYGAIKRLMQQPENNYKALRDSVAYGTVDLAPDIFYFNFMNISGRFFLGNDGEWKVDCNQNIEIVFDYRDDSNYILPFIEDFPYQYAVDQQPKTIKGFMLRDDRGNKYYFGGNTDAIEYRTDFFRMTEAENFASWIANTWYLTKVTDRHDNILYTFSYMRDRFMAQVINNFEVFKVSNSQNWMGGTYGNSFTSIDYAYPYLVEINAPIRLHKIFLADSRVVTFHFNNINNTTETFYPSYYNSNAPYTLRQLRPNPSNSLLYYYLQTEDVDIKQYQANASFIDKFNDPLKATGISLLNKICLNYGSEGVFNYKLEYDMGSFPMLNAVKIMNEAVHYNSQASIGTYRMKYNGLNQLPADHLSRAVDHWGYFNGSSYGYPSTTAEFETFKNRRDPNPQYCQLGLLQELIYPTGGSSVFEYESNDYSKYQSLDRQSLVSAYGIGGGVRIKSITEYEDTIHAKVLKKRTFAYKIPGTNTSSGQLSATPVYYWPNWTPCDAYGGYSISQSYFRNTSIVPLSNSFGPSVGYSYVEETFLDGSRNIYHFLNISDCHDQKFIMDFNNGQVSPFDQFGERFYGRGKLKYKESYTANGNKVQKIFYWYDDVYESFCSVLTSNLSWENDGNSGSFSHYNGGVYKLFYPRRCLIQESTTKYFDSDSIVDTKSYSVHSKTLTVQYGNYNHRVDIYQLMRISSYRSGFPSEIQYFSYSNDSNEPLLNTLALNQFCLPEISFQKTKNNVVSEERVTEYALYGGLILPKCILERKGGTMMDTLLSYRAYTPTGQLSKYREPGKPLVKLTWINNDNLISSKMEGQNHLTIYTYNNKWQIQKITFPNGNYNSYSYDDFGRLIEIRNRNDEWLKKYSYNYKNK